MSRQHSDRDRRPRWARTPLAGHTGTPRDVKVKHRGARSTGHSLREQVTYRKAKGARDRPQSAHAHVSFSALDPPDDRAVQPSPVREFFLRETSLLPQPTKSRPERHKVFACVPATALHLGLDARKPIGIIRPRIRRILQRISSESASMSRRLAETTPA
jgi:hypothetical protein